MATPSLWEELDAFDTFTYLVLCPIAMLASFVLLAVHLAYPKLRKQPGDLIVMIAFAELVLSAHWFASAVSTTYVTQTYADESGFCRLNMYAAVLAGSIDTLYNLSFLAYIIFALNNAIKKTYMPKRTFHVVSVAVSLLLVATAKLGRNKYGTCSVKVDNHSIIAASVVLFFTIILAAFVYANTSRMLPKFGIEMSELRRDFLNFYGSYLKAYMGICSTVFLAYFCQAYGENQNKPGSNRNFHGVLFNLGRLGNTAKALLPIVLFIIRSQDPLLHKILFRKGASRITKWLEKAANTLSPTNRISNQPNANDTQSNEVTSPINLSAAENDYPPVPIVHRDSTAKVHALEAELELEDDNVLWMNLLPGKVKETFTRTFLASIYSYYPGLIMQTF